MPPIVPVKPTDLNGDVINEIEGLRIFTAPGPADASSTVFSVVALDDDEVALVFMDITPYHPSAGYIKSMCRMAFQLCLGAGRTAEEVMRKVNRVLTQNIRSLHYLGGFFAVFDLRTNVMRYCTAGRARPFFLNADTGTVVRLAASGPCLGVFEDGCFPEAKFEYQPGDKLCVFPGGCNHGPAMDPKRAPARLFGLLEEAKGARGSAALKKIGSAFPVLCEMTHGPRKYVYLEKCGIETGPNPVIKTIHDFEGMSALIKYLLDAVDHIGYPIRFQKNFRLVLLELLTNAIIHGNRFDRNKKVVAVADVLPEQISIGVIDEGNGYDLKSIPDPLLPENINKQHGRGLFIVKHYSDEFRLIDPGNCTVVKFARKKE
jgi:serine/threonine-protein kinase RsbW